MRRLMNALIGIPIVIIALYCGASAYHIHAHNGVADTWKYPAMPAPVYHESILIVSPHPDDETLGCAGLVQQAVARKSTVNVLFLTCGDSFRVGVARYFDKFSLRSSDFVQYGEARQVEAKAANTTLGVPVNNIRFLGYPDQGTMPIWRDHWSKTSPYCSPYSHTDHVPYPTAVTPGNPFCGEAIVSDLVHELDRDRPTDVYVTHPEDDHPDHAAAAAFVTLAVDEVKDERAPWSKGLRLHYFLIHRGDWPVPQGLHTDQPLAPPAPMVLTGTMWMSLPLTAAQSALKLKAIGCYGTQTEMMGRFLNSFIRKNEMFGDLPPAPVHVSGDFSNNSHTASWFPNSTGPSFEDPVGDTIIRQFQAAGDITSVNMVESAHQTTITMNVAKAVNPTLTYIVHVRRFDSQGGTTAHEIRFSAHPDSPSGECTVSTPPNTIEDWSDRHVSFTVPTASVVSPATMHLFIEAETRMGRLTIDHTGVHEIAIAHLASSLQ
jgi:LmbE family N-acetylglucosaminyl deacetylase